MKKAIHTYRPDLYLIELVPPISGFDHFMGAWLYKKEITFLVDVGPTATLPTMLSALDTLKVTHLDFVLLTHIHLDHAGGVGDLSLQFPQTPIVCHPSGLAHLADPEHLLAGSLKTLGNIATAYGSMKAVPEGLLVAADRFHSEIITTVLTPGHSSHHTCYYTNDYLFAGEAAGVCIDLPDGQTWLRPATPPQHALPVTLASIDALLAVTPQSVCYGHFGIQYQANHYLQRHRRQLLLWEEVIAQNIKRSHPDLLIDNCLSDLFSKDPELSYYGKLTPDQKKRENFFLRNSIRGIAGYLTSQRIS